MRRSEAFPSNFLGKDDLDPTVILTIASVGREEMKNDDATEMKTVVLWQEQGAKKWIINMGNFMTLEDAYGEDTDDWTGKPVELFVDHTVMFGNKRVGGVRVRIPAGTPPAATTQQTNDPQSQSKVVKIIAAKVIGDWTILDTEAGKLGTDNSELGATLMSFGEGVSIAVVYHITSQGKQIIDTATLATNLVGEPQHLPVEEDQIPF